MFAIEATLVLAANFPHFARTRNNLKVAGQLTTEVQDRHSACFLADKSLKTT